MYKINFRLNDDSPSEHENPWMPLVNFTVHEEVLSTLLLALRHTVGCDYTIQVVDDETGAAKIWAGY